MCCLAEENTKINMISRRIAEFSTLMTLMKFKKEVLVTGMNYFIRIIGWFTALYINKCVINKLLPFMIPKHQKSYCNTTE